MPSDGNADRSIGKDRLPVESGVDLGYRQRNHIDEKENSIIADRSIPWSSEVGHEMNAFIATAGVSFCCCLLQNKITQKQA